MFCNLCGATKQNPNLPCPTCQGGQGTQPQFANNSQNPVPMEGLMKFKLPVAIFTILEGVYSIIVGLMLIIGGIFAAALIDWIFRILGLADIMGDLDEIFDVIGTGITVFFMVVFAIAGLIMIAFGALYLAAGIVFTKRRPQRWLAIILIILNAFGALNFLFALMSLQPVGILIGLIPVVCLVLLIIYLVQLGKRQNIVM